MKYYIPFIYFFKSRAKTILHKASFFILIAAPIFFFWCSLNGFCISAKIISMYFLGFTGMFSIYEIGYLYNDAYTTRFEEYPSHWLIAEDRLFVERNLEILIAIRIIYATICCLIIKFIYKIDIMPYCISLVGLYVIYALHNTIRNRWNIMTDFFLQVLKYCTVLFLNFNLDTIFGYCVAMTFAVPLLRTMEFTNKKRLNLNLFKNIDVSTLRILYHSIVFFISLLFVNYIEEYRCLAITSFMLLIFRIISLKLLKNKRISKIRSKNFEDVK